MTDRLKEFVKRPGVYRSLYFISAMILAFSLGILTQHSIQNRGNNPIIELPDKPIPLALQFRAIGSPPNPADFTPATESVTNPLLVVESDLQGAFVASKTGTKYYPSDCGSVSRIKVENRVYFTTEHEARDKGYDRTDACK